MRYGVRRNWLFAAGLVLACGGKTISHEDSGATPDVPDPLTRALRFNYDSECVDYDIARLDEPTSSLGHELVLRQRTTIELMWPKCGAIDSSDQAAREDCWDSLTPCEEGEDQLDSSQWPTESTVYELVGVTPERINPLYSLLGFFPEGWPNSETLHISSGGYYDLHPHPIAEAGPPGCNPNTDCSNYHYLDATLGGVALVICPAKAISRRDYLDEYALVLCVVQ